MTPFGRDTPLPFGHLPYFRGGIVRIAWGRLPYVWRATGSLDLGGEVVEVGGYLRGKNNFSLLFSGRGRLRFRGRPRTAETVAEDRVGDIVGRNDDEHIAEVDHIHGGLAAFGHLVGVDHCGLELVGALDILGYEVLGHLHGLLRLHRLGHHRMTHQGQQHKE